MSEFTKVKDSLVDKILEQGQRLRNAMVQSILQNDPHSADVLFHHNKKYNTPVSSDTGLTDQPLKDNKLITAFLHGDYLTKQQEELALSTIRSMSLSDVCENTDHTLGSKCTCITCTAYNTNNLKCDLRRTNPAVDKDTQFLKQVDSLKVVLQSILLNSLGQKKVNQGFSGQSSSLNETYFVEYSLPEVFIKNMTKSKSKVDSGLENNYVRVCARRTNNVIYLKQTNIHSVNNLYNCNLEDHNLIFTIRCKKSSHHKSEHLGVAKFNFGVFNTSKNASCGKSLPIYLDENSSISVGNIKVTIQLGAGNLYFGQEFLDAVLHKKECSLTSSLEEILHDNNKLLKNIAVTQPVSPVRVPICEESKKSDRTIVNSDRDTKNQSAYFHHSKERAVQTTLTKEVQVTSLNTPETEVKDTCKFPKDGDKNNFQAELLFGFIYISEAQLLTNPVNSFIKCQPYCQNDTSISRIVYDSSNPLYNFCETIPLLYDDSFILKLRENFTIVEFWNKSEVTEEVFGLARLPLHQFYLGYRNSVILHHLKRNKLPVIGTDWWEPVYSLDNNELIGQVQVLTALGTDEQIRNLQLERGFKNDVVKSKLTQPTLPKKSNSCTATSNLTSAIKKQTKPVRSRIFSQLNQPVIDNSKQVNQKVDVGIQSDLKMDSKPSNPPQMMDTLNSFLKLLEASQKPACVENGTNTDPSISAQPRIAQTDSASVQSPQLRKTSDLLDSLHEALNIDTKAPKKVEAPHFRAEILINSANQLPSRRKLKGKSKKTKRKSGKQEENILPSTYVTFETMPGDSLRFTSVFPKSTSPKWNFRCEVELPLDLVTNDQKKLIFKVWRKSTNAVLQPNMQTDLVLGFAALDLSVLGLGFPSVQGWFNIIDFSGKCNGQINVHVNPLEKINVTNTTTIKLADQNSEVDLDQAENDECNELLGRALKRKFTELDEITQRLRLRLSAVVSEDSDGSNDDMTDEFDNDINNLCVEDDFDLINFEEEARKFNVNYSSQKAEQKCKTQTLGPLSVETQPSTSDQKLIENSSGNVDKTGLLIEQSQSESSSETATSRSILGQRNLIDGKHRIDNLLEKLTLLASETNQPFSSRYVSGCSVLSNEQNDIKDIFQDLEQHSRPNITATSDFDPVMFQQLYGGSTGDSSKSLNGDNKVQSSCDTEGSLSDCRPNPDGQGPGENDKE